MNIHHLELFYYVARHGGISEAVRRMPYGIQQPAVSSQILQLEESLNTTLFHRRPFSLTQDGEELYGFIKPFFSELENVAGKLRGGGSQHLRIGASEIVLRDHLPAILGSLKESFPSLKFILRQGYQAQLEEWVANQELDLSLTLLPKKTPAGVRCQELFTLPMVLAVPRSCRLKSPGELWQQKRISETLITLPLEETLTKSFHEHLAKKGVAWYATIEVGTVELVETYVAKGFGYGLSLEIPGRTSHPHLRFLALPDFPALKFGALWQGKKTGLMEAFLRTVKERADQLLV